MPRFRLTVEYDGTGYVGWQRQDNGRSIQSAIEEAALKFTSETVTVRGAGRTDAGVHALGQVAHLDFQKQWPAETVRNALNAHLGQAGDTVAIIEAMPAEADFDARFSAVARHYVYRIVNRPAPLALERRHALWAPRPLDHTAMHEAAQLLVGRHDFTTFRSVQCQAKDPVQSLDRLHVTRDGHNVTIHASARSFLHNQIRSFAGTLRMVGEGSWSPEDVKTALEARDRAACGPVAGAEGLYFLRVDY